MKTLDHIRTLYDLIRITIRDAKACSDDPAFGFDMDSWLEYVETEDICYVCMAGAVMAKSIGVDTKDPEFSIFNLPFRNFTRNITMCMMIDRLRSSRLYNAEDDGDLKRYAFTLFGIEDLDDKELYKGVESEPLAEGDLNEWEKLLKNANRMKV